MVQLKKGVLRFAAEPANAAAPADSGARKNRGLGSAAASKSRAGDALDKQIERLLDLHDGLGRKVAAAA